MKKKLSFLAYGFLLISIWSICFLGYGMADTNTAAMGLAFTFLSIYYLQREYDFNLSKSDKWAVMAFPILFVCMLYWTMHDFGYFKVRTFNFAAWYQLLFYNHIINPVVIAFVVLLLGITKLKDLSNHRNIFIFTSITIFYSYFFMFDWKSKWFGGQKASFGTETSQKSEGKKPEVAELNTGVNLSDFAFINTNLDTVNLSNQSGKYTLIETWSEGCPPCVMAMNEMPGFYRSVEDKLSVYYVYESRKTSARNNFEKIFAYKEIDDKSKILVDIEQDLYNSINMSGFPYFLIFDANGKLLHHIRGYGDKEMIAAQISEHIK